MTFKQLVREVCKREGLRKHIDIAQITEILGHLSDLAYDDHVSGRTFLAPNTVQTTLVMVGSTRAKKKKKVLSK